MNKELQTISMLVIDIVEKAYSNNCKHHEGTYQIQIISQHYIHTQQEKHWPIPNISSPLFSLFENIRELKLIFRVPSWSWPTVWYSRWLRISTRNYPILGITNWTNHTPITYKITNHACPEYFSLQPIQNEINLFSWLMPPSPLCHINFLTKTSSNSSQKGAHAQTWNCNDC